MSEQSVRYRTSDGAPTPHGAARAADYGSTVIVIFSLTNGGLCGT